MPSPRNLQLGEIFANQATLANAMGLSSRLSEAIKIQYNEELDNYFIEYECYLKKYWEYEDLMSRVVEIDLKLENNGTTIASKIDVIIQVPDGVIPLGEENTPYGPSKPKPPKKPLTDYAKMQENLSRPLSPFGLGVSSISGVRDCSECFQHICKCISFGD